MKPAFTSSRGALAFALLVGVLLLLPTVIAKTSWLDRRQVYPAIPYKYGPFPFAQQKIFGQTSDVDIAIIDALKTRKGKIWTHA